MTLIIQSRSENPAAHCLDIVRISHDPVRIASMMGSGMQNIA
jgi:hypothetical protein